jgi:hypothetical protein
MYRHVWDPDTVLDGILYDWACLPSEVVVLSPTNLWDQADRTFLYCSFSFKKWQADNVVKLMDSPEVEHFKKDKDAAKLPVKKYGTGDEKGQAPKQSF